jgi:predicted RNA binding protein YcfA (HicA-like mRNA interferase family)
MLKWYGFERRKSTGSHQVYKRKGCPSISIPYHRPVRSAYVRKVLALIEQYVDETEA